jgi:hypothetical protein
MSKNRSLRHTLIIDEIQRYIEIPLKFILYLEIYLCRVNNLVKMSLAIASFKIIHIETLSYIKRTCPLHEFSIL